MIVKFLIYIFLSMPLIGAYAMLAIGIVVVFRASKVLNLAHGAMAMLPAYATYEASTRGLPMVLAVPIGIAVGALLGAATERFFVRPLARQGPTAQTVGTIAVYGLVVAATAQIWGSGSKRAPLVFPAGGVHVAGAIFRWGQIGLFSVALIMAGAFYALFRFTGIGLAMRGAAENPRAAGLMGINPDRMARIAWLMGGALAGLAGILLAAVTNLQPYSLSLQMLPAFVAALLGGFGSLPGAVAGAFIVGIGQGVVPAFALVPGVRKLASQVGMPQLVLTIIALVAMYTRGGRLTGADTRGALAGDADATPTHSAFNAAVLPRRDGGRRLGRYVVLALLIAWPFIGVPTFLRPLDTFSLLGDSILAAQYFIAAASIVMLTGWVGQISLSQAAFVGISAFGSALMTRHLGIGFPFSLLFGALLSAGACAVLGVVALRVRGLYLAVATLIFAWMADEYLFIVPWFAGKGGSTSVASHPAGLKGAFPFFDFTERKTFYFVVLAAASSVLFGLLNLRDSKTGRAFFAVRGSEMAAASLGVDVVRYKLMAFATAGFVAGVAGNLILAHQVTIVPEQFSLRASLLFLAIAVVGGLQSLSGTVAASILFAALSEVFFRVPALGEYLQLVSASLLAIILLVYPGGLAALPKSVRRLVQRLERLLAHERATPVRERVVAWWRRVADGAEATEDAIAARIRTVRNSVSAQLARLPMFGQTPALAGAATGSGKRLTGLVVPIEDALRAGAPEGGRGASLDFADAPGLGQDGVADGVTSTVSGIRALAGVESLGLDLRGSYQAEGSVIKATDITVRFGGLTAVKEASLEVRAGQIVGLIGPNGAGKTTLFNAISGLNYPASGTIELFGEDVTSLPVHQRASRGLGRTFQVIQLFPELTVFENLLVATHLHNPSSVLGNILVTAKSIRGELAAEETCRRVVRFLGLEDIADRPVGGLPFGTLRMIEIGRALVTGAPALMLDEPASGLDNNETDKLSELLLFVRRELNLSILLIEHDVRMVTGLSDYMYVLNRGEILAEGKPAAIQRDPAVVAAYLGEPVGEGVS
ncbi:MAG: branched-chain amino acid transport system ATP-binding protein [Acidimicrobiaceae bacterium]|nr:branched-chain amino acid transport system ATP-binding protein [Acidimicrobiaceae bacterium]